MYNYKSVDKINKGLNFDDIIKSLAKTKPFTINSSYPLILHLNFWRQDSNGKISGGFEYEETYYQILASIKSYFQNINSCLDQTITGYSGTIKNKLSDLHINDIKL